MRPSVVLAVAALLAWSQPAAALQRSVKAAVKAFASTPVEIQRPQVRLLETFVAPTQVPGDVGADTRVRYANRKQTPQFVLTGEGTFVNRSPQRIEAIALTTMPRDAFGESLGTGQGEQGVYKLHRFTEPIVKGGTLSFTWEQPVASDDIYEVALAVTAVRFDDGTIWLAPKDKVSEVFFQ